MRLAKKWSGKIIWFRKNILITIIFLVLRWQQWTCETVCHFAGGNVKKMAIYPVASQSFCYGYRSFLENRSWFLTKNDWGKRAAKHKEENPFVPKPKEENVSAGVSNSLYGICVPQRHGRVCQKSFLNNNAKPWWHKLCQALRGGSYQGKNEGRQAGRQAGRQWHMWMAKVIQSIRQWWDDNVYMSLRSVNVLDHVISDSIHENEMS